MPTPEQIRMARAAIGMSVRALAERSGVADSTIHRYETNRGGMQTTTLGRLRTALEDAGIIFIPADANGGPGVRLKA